MLNFTNTIIEQVFIHRVGSKFEDEGFRCSKTESHVNTVEMQELLVKFLLQNPFKSPEYQRFAHDAGWDNHPLYQHSQRLFSDPACLVELGEPIARQLYESSEHPTIKPGDLMLAYIRNVGYQGGVFDAFGIFKIENREKFLVMEQQPDNYLLSSITGIATDRLDKGCIILNADAGEGYKVCSWDKSGSGATALFWQDDFLGIEPVPDNFLFTKQIIEITRDFVNQQLPEEYEISKADQIDLLNRSADYFKTQDRFVEDEFASAIFGDPGVIDSFSKFKETAVQNEGFSLVEDFDISDQAVKKNSKVFKSVLKLDKNFHVYIHGNRDMIEKGEDTDGRKYYKLYYSEEN